MVSRRCLKVVNRKFFQDCISPMTLDEFVSVCHIQIEFVQEKIRNGSVVATSVCFCVFIRLKRFLYFF